MKYLALVLALATLVFVLPAAAQQTVGGLTMDYPAAFTEQPATANRWQSDQPQNIQRLTVFMKVYSAPPAHGLGEVNLVEVQYVPSIHGSIDGAAQESVRRIAALDGVKNLHDTVTPLVVSGFEARRISLSADRWGYKLGGEFLIILNRQTNTLWQLQLMFTKKNSWNPFSKVNLSKERTYAGQIISTVRVVR